MNAALQRRLILAIMGALLAACVTTSPTAPATVVTVGDSPRALLDKAADPDGALSRYLERSQIPPKLFWQLRAWEALPPWVLQSAKFRDDWVESFHKNVSHDWPKPLRDALATTEPSRGTSLAKSTTGHKLAITVFDRTPVFLREIQDIVFYPLVAPGSPDPNAAMLLDPERKRAAVKRLALLLGMLEETSYLDGPDTDWNGAVTFGTRFIYYHEVGHLALAVPGAWKQALVLLPEEEEFADEIRADQIGMALLAQELRNQRPEVIFAGFTGISIAICLMAAQEFVQPYKDGLRQTKGAAFRMERLLNSTEVNVQEARLPPDALTALRFNWDLFRELLREVKEVPSPVFELIQRAADQPPEEWAKERDEIVKWCAFGDSESVIKSVAAVYGSALENAPLRSQARRAVTVIEFIEKQTALLEPALGLSEALRSSAASPSGSHR